MNLPGTPSLLLLFYLLLLLPYAAIKSARRVRQVESGKSDKLLPSRAVIWINTILMLVTLFVFSWWVGNGFGFEIFALPTLGLREILAAIVALGLVFGLRAIVRAIRSDEERRKLVVYKLAPRGTREWLLWSAMIVCAGVAEEVAYRGVAMQILWYSLDNPWIAALISSLAFAAAHWVQGFKSGVMIFGIALVMHGLVAFTHTLVLAMFVHAIYDFIAGWLIRRQADVDMNQAASISASA
jgi:membrane protease YdiL (CAAX protease family)